MNNKKINRIVITTMLLSFFLSILEHIAERTLSFLEKPTPTWLVIYVTICMFVYIIIHAVLKLGWKKFVIFIFITAVISALFEGFKIASGFLVYSELMGTKVLGVPSMLPFWFFILIYSAYVSTNLIFNNFYRNKISSIIFLAFSDSVILTSWFTVEEPINRVLGTWKWNTIGGYFNSPEIIFFYWMLNAFIISVLYRLYEKNKGMVSSIEQESLFARYLPFFSYAWLALSAIVGAAALKQTGATVAGFFAMVPFILMGFYAIAKRKNIKNS